MARLLRRRPLRRGGARADSPPCSKLPHHLIPGHAQDSPLGCVLVERIRPALQFSLLSWRHRHVGRRLEVSPAGWTGQVQIESAQAIPAFEKATGYRPVSARGARHASPPSRSRSTMGRPGPCLRRGGPPRLAACRSLSATALPRATRRDSMRRVSPRAGSVAGRCGAAGGCRSPPHRGPAQPEEKPLEEVGRQQHLVVVARRAGPVAQACRDGGRHVRGARGLHAIESRYGCITRDTRQMRAKRASALAPPRWVRVKSLSASTATSIPI